MTPLDPQSFALGCLLGGVVAFVGAAAIGGWLERRKGPRAVMVRYLPRDPELDQWVRIINGDLMSPKPHRINLVNDDALLGIEAYLKYLEDNQPDNDPVVKALMAGHQAKKTRIQ